MFKLKVHETLNSVGVLISIGLGSVTLYSTWSRRSSLGSRLRKILLSERR